MQDRTRADLVDDERRLAAAPRRDERVGGGAQQLVVLVQTPTPAAIVDPFDGALLPAAGPAAGEAVRGPGPTRSGARTPTRARTWSRGTEPHTEVRGE